MDNIEYINSGLRYRTFIALKESKTDVIQFSEAAITSYFEIGKIVVASVPIDHIVKPRKFRVGMAFVRTEYNHKTGKQRSQFKREHGKAIAFNRMNNADSCMIVDLRDEERTFTHLLRSCLIHQYAKGVGKNGVSWMLHPRIIIRWGGITLPFIGSNVTNKRLRKLKSNPTFVESHIRTDMSIEMKHEKKMNMNIIEFAIYDETSGKTAIFKIPFVNIACDKKIKELFAGKILEG